MRYFKIFGHSEVSRAHVYLGRLEAPTRDAALLVASTRWCTYTDLTATPEDEPTPRPLSLRVPFRQ